MRNRVVDILMRRDNLTEAEANKAVAECQETLLYSDPWEAEEVILDLLGLEPDYLIDILEFSN